MNGVWDGKVIGGPLPKGVEIYPVAKAVQDPSLAGYFENHKLGNLPFANLNAALFTDGLFIGVSGTADKPLHIVHLYSADHNLMLQPRHVWVARANAELAVIESVFSATGGASATGDASTNGDASVQPATPKSG